MIRKLQKRFVKIAVLALTLAMVLVVVIVNAANLISVRNELTGTLRLVAENIVPADPPAEMAPPAENGWIRETAKSGDAGSSGESGEYADAGSSGESGNSGENPDGGNGTENGISEGNREYGLPAEFFRWAERNNNRHQMNLVSESNWFMVLFDSEGNIRNQRMTRAGETMDEETSQKLARQALETGQDSGWIQDYCFIVRDEGTRGKAVVMLNCETRMTAVRTLATISGFACVGGILLALALTALASRKAVEPVIRNMEQQKRFITDASHELKTPLTVISTNMELLKTEVPENPWVRSTQKQTSAMRHLVDELVYLSRMEEEHPALNMESLPAGKMLEEAAEPFQAMAEFGGKDMTVETEKELWLTGDRASIQRLISTLLDNAMKYTPEGGRIRAEARTEGKYAMIRISNTVETPLTEEQCGQMFNRFYRADESRSKERQKGFGIGLSIAAAIAEKHGGSIHAEMNGDMLEMTCLIPKK